MRDAGVVEQRTLRLEPEAFVEPDRLHLRVQSDDRVPTRFRLVQKAAEESRSDTRTTPVAEYRHPTDVPVRKESRRPDRQPGARFGQGVDAPGIVGVPFERLGHMLLDDEDGPADGRQSLGAGSPGDETDIESGRRMHGAGV